MEALIKQYAMVLLIAIPAFISVPHGLTSQVPFADQPYTSVRTYVVKKDPKGGEEHRVLTDVLLRAKTEQKLDMKVSFAIAYSFIPERVAKALGARRVGEIDFALVPPPKQGEGFSIPDHLAFYGMNRTKQTKFQIVRIERFDLGVGPTGGPVLDDKNSDFGLVGNDWCQLKVGNKGFVNEAVGRLHFIELPESEK
jgi:hypothetical protein